MKFGTTVSSTQKILIDASRIATEPTKRVCIDCLYSTIGKNTKDTRQKCKKNGSVI